MTIAPPPDQPQKTPLPAQASGSPSNDPDALALSNQVAELQGLIRAKDGFLVSLSHEFRAPLGAALGLAEAMRLGAFGPVSQEQSVQLSAMEDSGRHVLSMINDLIDLTRISLGQLPLQIGPVDLPGVCDVAMRLLGPEAERAGVHLDLQIPEPMGLIQGDGVRLKQMLLQLLSNAVHFSPQGGTVRMAVRRLDAVQVELSVADQGPGLPADHREFVLPPYGQFGTAGQRNHGGFGLGLALAQGLVNLHHGQLRLEASLGGGGLFLVQLPTGDAEPRPAETSPDPEELPVPAAAPAKLVVVVDDDDANRETVAKFLISQGYCVEQADSGLHGVELVERLLPDVVIMDIQMPGTDGLEAIQRLRANDSTARTTVIAVTALAMASDRDRCLAAGADHYLAKPVRLRELAQLVAQATAQDSQRTEVG